MATVLPLFLKKKLLYQALDYINSEIVNGDE